MEPPQPAPSPITRFDNAFPPHRGSLQPQPSRLESSTEGVWALGPAPAGGKRGRGMAAELLDCIAWTWAVLTTPTMLTLGAVAAVVCAVGALRKDGR